MKIESTPRSSRMIKPRLEHSNGPLSELSYIAPRKVFDSSGQYGMTLEFNSNDNRDVVITPTRKGRDQLFAFVLSEIHGEHKKKT